MRAFRHLFTFNFCPMMDERIGWLRHPVTALAIASLLALAIGLFVHGNGYVLFACLIAVLCLGVLWPWFTARFITGELRLTPNRIREGATGTAILVLRNRSWFAAWGLTIEGAPGEPPAIRCLGGRCVREIRWTFRAQRRGELPAGEVRIGTTFPFGLVHFSSRAAVVQPSLVWPRTYRVGSLPEASADAWRDGAFVSQREGGSGDVIAVRPYRRGDSLRRIHWTQTARRDRLIVCERQTTTLRRIRIVLGLGRCSQEDESLQEWAIRIAASLAESWIAEGVIVSLAGAGLDVPADAGGPHGRRLLDALARLPRNLAQEEIAAIADDASADTLIYVASDLAQARAPRSAGRGRKWIVLRSAGFRGSSDHRHCDEAPVGCEESGLRRLAVPSAWLTIRNDNDVPRALAKLGREKSHAC